MTVRLSCEILHSNHFIFRCLLSAWRACTVYKPRFSHVFGVSTNTAHLCVRYKQGSSGKGIIIVLKFMFPSRVEILLKE